MDLPPQRIETLLAELAAAESRYRGTMMVRAKCAPHFMRHVHHADPDSPVLSYRTRCPCGIDYCRITPDGKLTPCPYMPTEAGDLRRAVVRRDLVGLAGVRRAPQARARRPLRPLRVPDGVRRLPRARARHDGRLPGRGPGLRLRADRRPAARGAQGGELRQRAGRRPRLVARGERAHGEDPLVRARRRDAAGRGLRPREGSHHRHAASCSARSASRCRSTSRSAGPSS